MASLDLMFRITGDNSSQAAALRRAEADQRRYDLAIQAARREMEADLERSAAAERNYDLMVRRARQEMTADIERQAAVQAKAAEEQAAIAEQAAQAQSDAAGDMATGFAAAGAGIAAGLLVATNAAMNWQTAWTGVTKTVNGSTEEMAELEKGLRGLAGILPSSSTEIAAVAEAAGALGVQRSAIIGFTRTMIDLGNTTDLTSDQAATAIAQIANVMGTDLQNEVDNFGSALVALGNDGASTESQILEMAQRISGAGKVIGLSEQDVLAFSSALSSAGIEAEAGGSAISKVFIDVESSVKTGSDSLTTFAAVAGMSAQEFSTAFEEDPARAMQSFIEGLGGISAAGGNTFGILDSLGLSEVRTRDALLRLSGSSDLLAQSLATSNQAWDDNNALTAEASKRYQTAESRIAIAKNQLNDAAIDMGANLLPILVDAVDTVGTMGAAFAGLPEPVQKAVTSIAGLVAVGALASAAALKIASGLKAAAEARGGFIAASAAFAPWGIAIVGATVALGKFVQMHAESKRRVDEFTAAIEADSGALGENTRATAVNNLEKAGLGEAAAQIGISMDKLVDAALGVPEAMRFVQERIEANTAAATGLVDANGEAINTMDAGEEAAKKLAAGLGGVSDELVESQEKAHRFGVGTGAAWATMETADDRARAMSVSLKSLGETMGPLTDEQQAMIDKFGLAGIGAQKLAEDYASLTPEQQDLAAALGVTADEAKRLDEAAKRLFDSVRALSDPTVDAMQANADYHQALMDVAAAIQDVRDANDGALPGLNASATAFDTMTDAGQKLWDVTKGQRDAALANAEAIYTQTLNTNGQAEAERQWQDAMSASQRAMVTTLTGMGFTQEGAEALAASIIAIPESHETPVSLPGGDTALATAQDLKTVLDALNGYAVDSFINVHVGFEWGGRIVGDPGNGGTRPGPQEANGAQGAGAPMGAGVPLMSPQMAGAMAGTRSMPAYGSGEGYSGGAGGRGAAQVPQTVQHIDARQTVNYPYRRETSDDGIRRLNRAGRMGLQPGPWDSQYAQADGGGLAP